MCVIIHCNIWAYLSVCVMCDHCASLLYCCLYDVHCLCVCGCDCCASWISLCMCNRTLQYFNLHLYVLCMTVVLHCFIMYIDSCGLSVWIFDRIIIKYYDIIILSCVSLYPSIVFPIAQNSKSLRTCLIIGNLNIRMNDDVHHIYYFIILFQNMMGLFKCRLL